MPADPDITLIGVEKSKVNVYTSATRPLMLPMYIREKGKEEQEPNPAFIMFKTGDDMRQDALVLQIQNVMDSILRGVELDLKFNYYNTIAFTSDDGLLQFTPNS